MDLQGLGICHAYTHLTNAQMEKKNHSVEWVCFSPGFVVWLTNEAKFLPSHRLKTLKRLWRPDFLPAVECNDQEMSLSQRTGAEGETVFPVSIKPDSYHGSLCQYRLFPSFAAHSASISHLWDATQLVSWSTRHLCSCRRTFSPEFRRSCGLKSHPCDYWESHLIFSKAARRFWWHLLMPFYSQILDGCAGFSKHVLLLDTVQ